MRQGIQTTTPPTYSLLSTYTLSIGNKLKRSGLPHFQFPLIISLLWRSCQSTYDFLKAPNVTHVHCREAFQKSFQGWVRLIHHAA